MKTQKIFQIKARVVKNNRINRNYYALTLDSRRIASCARPGQFLDIRASQGYEPLLRRPLSIHRLEKNRVELLYEVVGPGTKILSEKKAGEYLDILGPLGNGFTLKPETGNLKPDTSNLKPNTSHLKPILVAGGIGVAPLLFLAQKLAERIAQSAKPKPLILIGARTKSQVLCEKEFKSLGISVKIATDDGSSGFRGKVTDLLKDFLLHAPSSIRSALCPTPALRAGRRYAIYACGPKPMLKEICRISREHKIPAQVSLEAHMACGIGACLGCVVDTIEGYKRVCKEGPVFEASQIIWGKE